MSTGDKDKELSGTPPEDENGVQPDAAGGDKHSEDSPKGSAASENEPGEETPGEDDQSPGASGTDGEEATAESGDSQPPSPPAPPADDEAADEDPDEDPDEEEDEEDEDSEEEQMSFLDHMGEMRVRLTRSALAALVGFLACYGFSKQLFELLMRPLVAVFPPDTKLIYTALPEAFFTYIKVALVAGILLVSPYIFYQIWCFVAPGLYKNERKYLLPIAFFSGLFFTVGAGFGYSVVFPFAFEFFMDFATETIRPMPSLSEYFSFSLKLLFAFGLIFELPLFIFFLARLGMVNSRMLRKVRKYAFLCAFIISAILTPPDVVSQTLMAGPLIVLYELSIWVAHVFGKKRPEPEAEDEDEEEEAAGEDQDASKTAE